MTSTSAPRTLSLSRLLRRAVVGARGQKLGGRLSDVIVRLRDADYPLVTGLVAELGGHRVFVPAQMVTDWDTEQVSLSSARVDLRAFERRAGEVLLRSDARFPLPHEAHPSPGHCAHRAARCSRH